jgi:hypothetical protein
VHGTHEVQVVLGEGEPGILRLVLEAQGFQVVGHARDEDQLRAVLDLTEPSVIVLDAGIPAIAVADIRARSDGVPIVVVWPKDAVSVVAEERVEPAAVILELGNAVRRVVQRHPRPVVVPEAPPEPVVARREISPVAHARTARPRARHLAVVAAAWTISVVALGAVGFALPGAIRALEGRSFHTIDAHPRPTLTPEREAPAATSDGDGPGRPECADHERPRAGREAPRPASNGGCGRGAGKGGRGHGRPEDPGRGSGQGDHQGGTPPAHASGHGRPDDTSGSSGDSGGSGGGGQGGGNGGDRGGRSTSDGGTQDEHRGAGGRSAA